MPRIARQFPPYGAFHLICRSNDKRRIFRYKRDFRAIKRSIERRLESIPEIRIQHYVIMHTHLHLLIWCDDTTFIPPFMQGLQISYHYHYRRHYNYQGGLWHSRYRCFHIDNESYLRQCGRYIELNPVRAGLCKLPDDYQWSSFHHFANGTNDSLVAPCVYPEYRRGRPDEEYRQFVHADLQCRHHEWKNEALEI